jgi:nuclear transport factor 2 (NTF2) superfamily protein
MKALRIVVFALLCASLSAPASWALGHEDDNYGNEQWEFDPNGLMQRRYASINDLPIESKDRKFL